MLASRLIFPVSGVALSVTAGLILPAVFAAIVVDGTARPVVELAKRPIVLRRLSIMIFCWPVPSAVMESVLGSKNCTAAAIVAAVVTSLMKTKLEGPISLQSP
jgi:hypothetical protein